jgi:hypothetical protein
MGRAKSFWNKWSQFETASRQNRVSASIIRGRRSGSPSDQTSAQVRQRQARRGDWLLQFELPGGTSLEWLYVDFVIQLPRSDKFFEKEWPLEAVQANRPNSYSRPPFKIDQEFRIAFRR